MTEKPIRSMEQFMRRFFPKEYERRKAEGRCMHCGAKRSERDKYDKRRH